MLDVHSPDVLSPHLGLVQVVYGHLGLFRLGQLNQDQGSVLLIKRKLNSINFAVRGEEGEEVVALSFGLAYVGHKQDAARGAEVPSQVGKSHGSQGISPHLTLQAEILKRAVVRPRKNFLTLRKILRFACVN